MQSMSGLIWLTSCALSLVAVGCAPAFAQSLDVKHPAELKEGINKATIDSFGSSQFWFFNAKPGNFKASFVKSGAKEGFSVGGATAGAGAVINPAVKGSTLVSKDTPSGAEFTGHCDQPSRIIIMIEPPKSALVRQTSDYTLTVSGSSGSADAISAAPDNVAGVYDVNMNNYGMAKLSADGSITTTSGATGNWTLFDAATRSYVINIGSDKWNVTFEPARGFVNNNGQLYLTCKKVVK